MLQEKSNLSKMLRAARLEKGLTQLELSQLSGIGLRSIQRIEGGEVQPRAYTLKVLCGHLEVQLDLGPVPLGAFLEGQKKRAGFNLHQKLIISLGAGLLLVLLGGAFLSQTQRFPETNFERFSFWAVLTVLYLASLLRTWR